MAWTLYNSFKEALFDPTVAGAAIDLEGDTIKIMLVTSSYTPDAANHDFIDDANGNEVSGTNYTAGGEDLANDSVTESGGTVTYDADDVTWSQSASGFSNARIAIAYKDTGTPSTSPLIAYNDFGSDKGNVDGDLTLEMDTDGILELS
jgi:hypothetical protein